MAGKQVSSRTFPKDHKVKILFFFSATPSIDGVAAMLSDERRMARNILLAFDHHRLRAAGTNNQLSAKFIAGC